MNKMVNSVCLFGMLFALTQLVTAQDTPLPIPDIDISQLDPLDMNAVVFEPLRSRFGNVGIALDEMVTSPGALGNEFAGISSLIVNSIGFDDYRKSVNTIMGAADNIDFQRRLQPLLNRVRDVQDPNTKETLGQAMDIVRNIFEDNASFDELINRIRNENPTEQA